MTDETLEDLTTHIDDIEMDDDVRADVVAHFSDNVPATGKGRYLVPMRYVFDQIRNHPRMGSDDYDEVLFLFRESGGTYESVIEVFSGS